MVSRHVALRIIGLMFLALGFLMVGWSSSLLANVPPIGVVAAWDFEDQGAGGITHDVSGLIPNMDGQMMNGATIEASGDSQRGYVLNPVNLGDGVKCLFQSKVAFGDDFTFQAWIKCKDAYGDYLSWNEQWKRIAGVCEGWGVRMFSMNSGMVFDAQLCDENHDFHGDGWTPIQQWRGDLWQAASGEHQWHHLLVTFDQYYMYGYIDGILVQRNYRQTRYFCPSNQDWNIAYDNGNMGSTRHYVDDVAFFRGYCPPESVLGLYTGAYTIHNVPLEEEGPEPYAVQINTDDGLQVSEEGPTSDTFTVVMTQQPDQDVVVTMDPDTDLQINSGGAGNPVSHTFTSTNWNVPQTVTVTAVADGLVQGIHTGTITLTTNSNDYEFQSVSIPNVTAQILEGNMTISSFQATPGTPLDGGKDSFSIRGSFDANDILGSTMAVSIDGSEGNIWSTTLTTSNFRRLGAGHNYLYSATVNGASILMMLNVDRGTVMLMVRNVDLSGLKNPFMVSLTSGSFRIQGTITAEQNIKFLKGVEDTLRISGGSIAPAGRFNLRGSLAAENYTDIISVVTLLLNGETLASFPGEGETLRRTGSSYLYMRSRTLNPTGKIDMAMINLDSGTVTIQGTGAPDPGEMVDVGLQFTNESDEVFFDATDTNAIQ